jgi:glyoxylase-like metal-dependent hydrolase (beta-lactamase superfamily II)
MKASLETAGPEGVFRLRSERRNVYLLVRGQETVLVGAGNTGHLPLIGQALSMNALGWDSLRAVLLTDGDPLLCANIPEIRTRSRALVNIHRFEEPRLAMRTPASTGRSLGEFLQRRAEKRLPMTPCQPDLFIADGDTMDLWYGLAVVGLPGPSAGHCGFYCRHLNLLFCGALRMSPSPMQRLLDPPPANREALKESRTKVAKMKPRWILES